MLQGSISNNDFIDGWSDLDSFVVIRNETLLDYKKIITVQKLLKEFYKLILKIFIFSTSSMSSVNPPQLSAHRGLRSIKGKYKYFLSK